MKTLPWLPLLAGRWNGTYRLIVNPAEPPRDSKTSADICRGRSTRPVESKRSHSNIPWRLRIGRGSSVRGANWD